MDRQYEPLSLRELGPDAGFGRPTQAEPARVGADSPALEAMTDLTKVAPATIRPQAPLAGANRYMITRGVRLLLVVDDAENVLGVISAADLLGERPMLVATERRLRRDELTVADVMTPAASVQVVALAEVESARVGHVLETLRREGRQHLLVVDAQRKVRGVFSLSQIARQLGVTLQAGTEVAHSFSEIEAAIR